jgi:hypothetical protein
MIKIKKILCLILICIATIFLLDDVYSLAVRSAFQRSSIYRSELQHQLKNILDSKEDTLYITCVEHDEEKIIAKLSTNMDIIQNKKIVDLILNLKTNVYFRDKVDIRGLKEKEGEYLDILDDDNKVIGKGFREKRGRDIPHVLGLKHRCAMAFILDPETQEFIFQRRSHFKYEPLSLNITGGHCPYGESYKDTLVKKIEQEYSYSEDLHAKGTLLRIGDEGGFVTLPEDKDEVLNWINKEARSIYVYIPQPQELKHIRRVQKDLEYKRGSKSIKEYSDYLVSEAVKQRGAGEIWDIVSKPIDEIKLEGVNSYEDVIVEDLSQEDFGKFSGKIELSPGLLKPLLADQISSQSSSLKIDSLKRIVNLSRKLTIRNLLEILQDKTRDEFYQMESQNVVGFKLTKIDLAGSMPRVQTDTETIAEEAVIKRKETLSPRLKMEIDNLNKKCSVCFEAFIDKIDSLKIIGCKHVFCEECLNRVLSLEVRIHRCPLCREEIRNYGNIIEWKKGFVEEHLKIINILIQSKEEPIQPTWELLKKAGKILKSLKKDRPRIEDYLIFSGRINILTSKVKAIYEEQGIVFGEGEVEKQKRLEAEFIEGLKKQAEAFERENNIEEALVKFVQILSISDLEQSLKIYVNNKIQQLQEMQRRQEIEESERRRLEIQSQQQEARRMEEQRRRFEIQRQHQEARRMEMQRQYQEAQRMEMQRVLESQIAEIQGMSQEQILIEILNNRIRTIGDVNIDKLLRCIPRNVPGENIIKFMIDFSIAVKSGFDRMGDSREIQRLKQQWMRKIVGYVNNLPRYHNRVQVSTVDEFVSYIDRSAQTMSLIRSSMVERGGSSQEVVHSLQNLEGRDVELFCRENIDNILRGMPIENILNSITEFSIKSNDSFDKEIGFGWFDDSKEKIIRIKRECLGKIVDYVNNLPRYHNPVEVSSIDDFVSYLDRSAQTMFFIRRSMIERGGSFQGIIHSLQDLEGRNLALFCRENIDNILRGMPIENILNSIKEFSIKINDSFDKEIGFGCFDDSKEKIKRIKRECLGKIDILRQESEESERVTSERSVERIISRLGGASEVPRGRRRRLGSSIGVTRPVLKQELTGHTREVTSIARVDQNIIATGSLHGTVRIWNNSNSEYRCIQELIGHAGEVFSVIRINAKTIATCSKDGIVKIWEKQRDNRWICKQTIGNQISSIAKLNENKIVIGYKNRKKAEILEKQDTGEWRSIEELGKGDPISIIKVISETKIILVGDQARIWYKPEGSFGSGWYTVDVLYEDCGAARDDVSAVEVLDEETFVLVVDGELEIKRLFRGHIYPSRSFGENIGDRRDKISVIRAVDKNRIIIGYEDNTVKLWQGNPNPQSGSTNQCDWDCRWIIPREHLGSIYSIEILDEATIAIDSGGETVKIWSVPSLGISA